MPSAKDLSAHKKARFIAGLNFFNYYIDIFLKDNIIMGSESRQAIALP